MARVYDFRTGQLCKCCTACKFWKGIKDFPKDFKGLYGRAATCNECWEGEFIHKELTGGGTDEVA